MAASQKEESHPKPALQNHKKNFSPVPSKKSTRNYRFRPPHHRPSLRILRILRTLRTHRTIRTHNTLRIHRTLRILRTHRIIRTIRTHRNPPNNPHPYHAPKSRLRTPRIHRPQRVHHTLRTYGDDRARRRDENGGETGRSRGRRGDAESRRREDAASAIERWFGVIIADGAGARDGGCRMVRICMRRAQRLWSKHRVSLSEPRRRGQDHVARKWAKLWRRQYRPRSCVVGFDANATGIGVIRSTE